LTLVDNDPGAVSTWARATEQLGRNILDTLFQKLVSGSVSPVIGRDVSAGGTLQMPPTSVDGYHFAIIQDPEGNRLA
jgi:predicted enzyme related to lactoylglutathione lyase